MKGSRFRICLFIAILLMSLASACTPAAPEAGEPDRGDSTERNQTEEEATEPAEEAAADSEGESDETAGGGASGNEGGSATSGTVRIGFFGALSGNFASSGKDLQAGIEMYLQEIDSMSNGCQIELISEDTAGDPTTALAKARKLIEQDKVHVLIGPNLTSSGYAVRDYIDESQVPTLFAVVSADDITQRQRTPWIIRTGWSTSQSVHAFGQWVYEHEGIERIATLSYDYGFGWENVGGFQAGFENAGGQVVQKIWNPTDTKDFAPYIANLNLDNIDAIFVQQSGGNAVRVLQQLEEFGIKGTIPVYGGGTLTDEAVLRSMGDEALDLITALHWSAALDRPEAQAFVEKFKEQHGFAPGYRAEAGYGAVKVVAEALAEVGCAASAEALRDAMQSVELEDAPRGPISFDEYGGVIQNIYIRKVERVDGELQNTVLETIADVSQFWPFEAEEFLANPVYSRDFPPCEFCE